MSTTLLEIASAESEKNNQNLSMFCNFLSEQVLMSNLSCNERTYPEHFFTTLCCFALRSNSRNHCEMIRKNMRLFLPTDERTLFNVNQIAALPADATFNEKRITTFCSAQKNF